MLVGKCYKELTEEEKKQLDKNVLNAMKQNPSARIKGFKKR